MCGVIGYYSEAHRGEHEAVLHSLIQQAAIRGLHAYGLAHPTPVGVRVRRSFVLPQEGEIREAVSSGRVIYHNRYSTSGDWEDMANNQPIDIGGIQVVGNCVITQAPKDEWEGEFGVSCVTENDTEIMARLMEGRADMGEFSRTMRGSFAGLFLEGRDIFVLRNLKRPLWWFDYLGARWVVSTRDIVRRAFEANGWDENMATARPVEPFKFRRMEELGLQD